MDQGLNEKLPEKLTRPYSPKDTEDRIYKLWEESGFFNPDVCIEKGITKPDAEYFSIVLPPPNVTGNLHTGHALMLVIQDIMIRYKRMQGFKTLWLPGTDHAAIATQSKVEKEIQKKEGKSRHDLGREEMLKRIKEYAAQSHDTIVNQCKKMGVSLDWSREAFTLDEKRNLAVRTAFKQMYDEGLIYRGNRIVNWDPKGQTTISDDEIVYEERKSKLYTFKYSKDFPISISTTRPETKVGDVAVAVHPDDKRYAKFVGKEYDLEFCGVPIHIRIIADKEVDPAFGTGALGVTPAHSMIDWQIAERHLLPHPKVINEYAKMAVGGENLLGKKTTEAREIIVEWLKSEELLEKEEDINQNIATAERTGGIIEPLPKLQWFVDVNKKIPSRKDKTLKELMIEPVTEGKIKITPSYFEKVYFNWVNNLHDWCISRQIWYGHRIPVWYDTNGKTYCGINPPEGNNWTQDEDTLDTWFSAGLWTFSTLGWPEKTQDLATYHPTSMLETGYDILPIWVTKMILMSQYLVGDIPFKNVYLHGIIRTADGKKMSKSLGEKAIDPLDIIAKYGNDALRMAMIVGNAPGNDLKLDENDIKGYGKFANKLWNVARFVLDNAKEEDIEKSNFIKEFDEVCKDITTDMENLRFHLASEKIYHYIWHRFADEIIEESKKQEEVKKSLLYILKNSLKLLHPFMPFVTEEIWSVLPKTKDKNLLLVEKWPFANARDLRPQ